MSKLKPWQERLIDATKAFTRGDSFGGTGAWKITTTYDSVCAHFDDGRVLLIWKRTDYEGGWDMQVGVDKDDLLDRRGGYRSPHFSEQDAIELGLLTEEELAEVKKRKRDEAAELKSAREARDREQYERLKERFG